ncbi:hypothetical protein JRO89_XS15G0060800 [Xanthoceras sorbifolium]|uniref:Retrovirus-related Pol polyprotein from transposon TNT 1-94-like beta-barrel domain-containing protein n=1 Tax=Xanthoceras sorbifolium TaxID=99658 RepID=A0ABQ8H146_9ROSI|nr:hypothetical protein JRO89_XS15G0060800 [Xanthoceras sorbifolium]
MAWQKLATMYAKPSCTRVSQLQEDLTLLSQGTDSITVQWAKSIAKTLGCSCCQWLPQTAPWSSQQAYRPPRSHSWPSILGAPPQTHFAAQLNVSNPGWILNSGASHHVTVDLNNLSLHSNYEGTEDIMIGDGTGLSITHIGTTRFPSKNGSFVLVDILCDLHTRHLSINDSIKMAFMRGLHKPSTYDNMCLTLSCM